MKYSHLKTKPLTGKRQRRKRAPLAQRLKGREYRYTRKLNEVNSRPPVELPSFLRSSSKEIT